MTDTIAEKKKDVDELIKDVLQKIPEGKKVEALRILEGYALGGSDHKKAG